MANIKEYENPVAGFRATDTGVDAVAMAARRATQAYDQAASAVRGVAAETGKLGSETRELGSETARVGDHFATNLDQGITQAGRVASDYLTHRDISMGAVAYTKMTQTLTDAWNQMSSAPGAENDPTLAQKFRDTIMEPELQKFQEGFLTDDSQKWSLSRADALRQHMADKTTADMGNLAARAVEVHAHQTVNNLSNTAMGDPSAVPHLLAESESTIGAIVDTSPNVRGTEAAKLRMTVLQQAKEAIVKAGAIGAIQKSANPEATAAQWSQQYPDFINGAEVKILAANARQQIRARNMDAERQTHMDKIRQQDQSDQSYNQYQKAIYSNDPQQMATVTADKILNDPSLTRRDKDVLIHTVNREMKPETDKDISARNFSTMSDRILNDQMESTREIDLARSKPPGDPGSITLQHAEELKKMWNDQQSPEGSRAGRSMVQFFKAAEKIIDPSNPFGPLTERGSMKMLDFRAAVAEKVREYRKLGSGKTWGDLFDPKKPDYVGNMVDQYRSPWNAQVHDIAQKYLGAPSAPEAAPSTTNHGSPPQGAPPGTFYDEKAGGWRVIMNGKRIKVTE